jgi:hypothetical protein
VMAVIFKYLILCVFLCMAGVAAADCVAPSLTALAGRTIADTRPIIRWSAVEGATAYAVKLVSRVPEGRLVASFDVVVTDTQFVPPAALADERAKVTVTIAARCAGALSASATTWFLIDATTACPSLSPVRFKREDGRGHADWASSQGATSYEARLHAALDGRALKVIETREPRVVLEGDLPDGAVLSVRARCAQGFGEPAFGIIAN